MIRFIKPLRVASVLAAAIALGSCSFPGSVPNGSPSAGQAEQQRIPPFIVTPLEGVSDAELEAAGAAGKTLPYFTGSIGSPLDGKTYIYRIAGKPPHKSDGTTSIPYVPIMLVIHYPDGTVLDSTKPGCGDSVSIEQRLLKGPNFEPTNLTSNGVNVGKVQLGDAQQRAEFWKVLKGSGYHTVLQAASDAVVVHVTAPSSSYTSAGVCTGAGHRVGFFPLDQFLQITRTLAEKYSTPSQIPILTAYNTVQIFSNGGCCVAGDHGAFKRPSGMQTFVFDTYSDAGAVPGWPMIQDVTAVTHEIGELLNDPFAAPIGNNGANIVPAWGHIGQSLLNCSTILEVGDPLSGTNFELKHNGFTYHPQDLAFFSWFFRKKSIGTGGKYSFKGTLTTTQPLCR